jgi:hypothetical protein
MRVADATFWKGACVGLVAQSAVALAALPFLGWIPTAGEGMGTGQGEAVSRGAAGGVMNPRQVSEALFAIHDDPGRLWENGGAPFEEVAGQLDGYFLLVNDCIVMDVCGPGETLRRVCADLSRYRRVAGDRHGPPRLATLDSRCLEDAPEAG